jgi:mannan endo-1,4-beta-mannosidase
VVNAKGSPFSLTPAQNDANMYVDEEMNFLLQTYGNSSTAKGVKGYELDNEPDIWYADGVQQGRDTGTHPKLYPQPLRVDAFLAKTLDLAKTIKRMDPAAEVFGPAFANYAGYVNLHFAPDWGNYAGAYPRFVETYLAKMNEYSRAEGKRLLDVFTLHWYSQEGGVDSDDESPDVVQRRLQAPRSLWDDTFVEKSWITEFVTNMTPIQQIPDLQRAVENYFPGTKIGFTEWRFGIGDNISTGIATADALGIFGKHDVYFATFFEKLEGYVRGTFMLYRNYDGNGGKFGNKKIFSSTDDIEKTSVYASVNDNGSEMHLVVLNKTNEIIEGRFSITSDRTFKPEVKAFGFSNGNPTVNALGSADIVNMNQFTYNVPPLSALHLVLTSTTTGIADEFPAAKEFALNQNYPNPFNPSTIIEFSLPNSSDVTLKIYNALGEEIATLASAQFSAGTHRIEWKANGVSSGMYFYRLSAGNFVETKKLVLLR